MLWRSEAQAPELTACISLTFIGPPEDMLLMLLVQQKTARGQTPRVVCTTECHNMLDWLICNWHSEPSQHSLDASRASCALILNSLAKTFSSWRTVYMPGGIQVCDSVVEQLEAAAESKLNTPSRKDS